MKSRATSSPARSAHAPYVSEGMARLLSLGESYGWVNFVKTKEAPHPVKAGCGILGEALVGRIGGVDSVHTLGPGLGRTGAGLGRIPYVLAGVQCLQGRESSVCRGWSPVRVPPRAQCFLRSRAF